MMSRNSARATYAIVVLPHSTSIVPLRPMVLVPAGKQTADHGAHGPHQLLQVLRIAHPRRTWQLDDDHENSNKLTPQWLRNAAGD